MLVSFPFTPQLSVSHLCCRVGGHCAGPHRPSSSVGRRECVCRDIYAIVRSRPLSLLIFSARHLVVISMASADPHVSLCVCPACDSCVCLIHCDYTVTGGCSPSGRPSLFLSFFAPAAAARGARPARSTKCGMVMSVTTNIFSLHVRCTCSSHGRPYDPSGRGHGPIFWLILSALLK